MRVFIFILCLGVCLSLNAQRWRRGYFWAQSIIYPISPREHSMFMFESSQGNYIAGAVSVTSLSGSPESLRIMGINTQGQTLWTKEYLGNFVTYAQNTRNCYVRDNYFYYTSNKWKNSSSNEEEGVLTKFDFNGDSVWQKTYVDTVSGSGINFMSVTGSIDGGLLIIGRNTGYSSCILIKTDIQGNELWRKQIADGSATKIYGVALLQDSVSKKILIGCNTSDYGSNIYNGHLQLLICDSLGNKLSANVFQSNHGQVLDLIQTKDKNFIAVGDIDDGFDAAYGYEKRKPMAVKFQITSGNTIAPIWTMTNNSNYSNINEFKNVCELSDGNLILGGTFDGDTTQSIQLIRFSKLSNNNGSVLWNRYYDYYTEGLVTNEAPYLYSLASSSDNGWVAANFWQRFPPKNYRYPLTLFVKYDENGCDSTLAYCTVGIKENRVNKINLSVYPNPASNIVTVELPQHNVYDLKVSNTLGIICKEIFLVEGNTEIDVSQLKSGIYFMQIYEKGKLIATQKVIKA